MYFHQFDLIVNFFPPNRTHRIRIIRAQKGGGSTRYFNSIEIICVPRTLHEIEIVWIWDYLRRILISRIYWHLITWESNCYIPISGLISHPFRTTYRIRLSGCVCVVQCRMIGPNRIPMPLPDYLWLCVSISSLFTLIYMRSHLCHLHPSASLRSSYMPLPSNNVNINPKTISIWCVCVPIHRYNTRNDVNIRRTKRSSGSAYFI